MVTTLREALRSLREQGNRTWLSSLGVTVGTIAILLLISIARGVQEDVGKEVRDIGVNILIVLPGRVESGNFNPNLAGQSYLKEEDAARIRQIPGVVRALPFTFAGGGAKAGGKEAYPVNIAVDPDWFLIHKTELAEGRVMTSADRGSPVCVLGGVAKEALFGEGTALGKKVDVNGKPYTVVGVSKPKEQGNSLFSMFSFENVIYLPYDVVRKSKPDMQIDRIMVQTAPEVEPKSLKAAVDAELGKRLDRQQYSVLTEDDLLGLIYRLMSILTWLVTGLTSIAVFVGGMGIMTAMLMSVNERSKEIGIRKTVGATHRDVFRQFLVESLAITLFGGCVGLVCSYAAGLALRTWTPIKPLFSIDVILIGFAVGVGLGTVFGVAPALLAARKDPIQALRHE